MQSRYSIIDFNALAANFTTIKEKVGSTKVMAIVKANAYGHGLVPCALFLQVQGADYFGVALIEEAIELRNAGITLPILVLGGVIAEQIPLFLQYDIEIMASSIDKLHAIDACAAQYGTIAKIHLKIDTGLGRIGVKDVNAWQFFSTAISLQSIKIVGVASHFATADSQNTAYMRMQCQKFHEATQFFPQQGLPMPLRHIANSGAIMQLQDSYFDMVRPGIMLYGVYPQSWMRSLCAIKPVLSLYARIVYFKVVLPGSGISYGLHWTAEQISRIVTLPIGYGDGYPRALSNKGFVLITGRQYPIVGNICMDQMMVNIGSDSAYCGDEVTMIGTSGNLQITINDLADACNSSAYEFMVLLNLRIARKYLYPTLMPTTQMVKEKGLDF